MSGEYIIQDHEGHSDTAWAPDDMPTKHGRYLQGNYLRCVAEVSFHSEFDQVQIVHLWR